MRAIYPEAEGLSTQKWLPLTARVRRHEPPRRHDHAEAHRPHCAPLRPRGTRHGNVAWRTNHPFGIKVPEGLAREIVHLRRRRAVTIHIPAYGESQKCRERKVGLKSTANVGTQVTRYSLRWATAHEFGRVFARLEEVLACGAAHHQALPLVVAAREVHPAHVVLVCVAAVRILLSRGGCVVRSR